MKLPINRILLAFKSWEEKKTELQALTKPGAADERILDQLQLQHLREARHRLRGNTRPDEQPFLALLNNQMKRLEKKLHPNSLQRWFFRLKDQWIDGPAYLRQQAAQRAANIEQLKQQLQDKGLGSVAGRLEDHLNPDAREVCLPLNCQLGEQHRLEYDLWFEKDVYGDFQWHRLDGRLKQKGEFDRSHVFDLNDWPGLKADQALALLENRAIKQDYTDATGRANSRWVELYDNEVHHYKPGHFNAGEALNALPQITYNKEELVKRLENGQRVATHWKQDGQFQTISVQAEPATGKLRLFDGKQNPVTAEQLGEKAKRLSAAKKPEAMVQQQRQKKKNGHTLHL